PGTKQRYRTQSRIRGYFVTPQKYAALGALNDTHLTNAMQSRGRRVSALCTWCFERFLRISKRLSRPSAHLENDHDISDDRKAVLRRVSDDVVLSTLRQRQGARVHCRKKSRSAQGLGAHR